MADDQEVQKLVNGLAEVGISVGGIIPIALRVARRRAKEMPNTTDLGKVECTAFRLVALALVTNGFLMLSKSTEEGKLDQMIDENVKFARFLVTNNQEEDESEKVWLTDEQLAKMFYEKESDE